MSFNEKKPSSPSEEKGNDAISNKLQKWWSDDEESIIRRKLDLRILLISFTLYLIALLDRGNIGNANTAGMSKDLGMNDAQYRWLLTIFYLAYIVFQFFVLAYKILPPRIWVSICVLVWGIASVLQASAQSWGGMMACRFFLGMAEAGYGTGVALYMSFFYPKNEMGLRFGVFVTGGAVSSAIAGAIAYGLVHAHSTIESWRLLFLIEGVPTLLMVPVVYFCLPDSIETASFLTAREKHVAEARLFRPLTPPIAEGQKVTIGIRFREHVSWKNASSAFLDPLSYLMAVLFFIINVAYSSVPVYLPTLISEMGYGSIKAQGLSAPPYVAAFLFAIFCCWLTDRLQVRGTMGVFLLALGGSGYIMLATLRSTAARYVAVWMIVVGLFAFIPLLYVWMLGNQAGESKKGMGLVIFATIGQCGPLLGTRIFPAVDKPYYVKGTAISGGLLLFGAVVCSLTSLYLWNINRRRDAKQGTAVHEEENKLDVLMRGEDSPYFRYTI